MLKVINPSYAEMPGRRPTNWCIVTLYLFITLLRCAGRCISMGERFCPIYTNNSRRCKWARSNGWNTVRECWLDARVRKCNEDKESCVRLGASSNMTLAGRNTGRLCGEVSTGWLNQVKLSITMWHMGI